MKKADVIQFQPPTLGKAKNCPFCDAPNNWLEIAKGETKEGKRIYAVFCSHCGVTGAYQPSPFWAVEKWNRRPGPPPGFFRRLADRLKGGRA